MAMCTTLSLISLWRKITRPSLLQPRACYRVKWASQSSQRSGRLDGASPYRMERASRNSCAESSVPLTVGESTESHAPVSRPRPIVRCSQSGSPLKIDSICPSSRVTFRLRISAFPADMIVLCSGERNISFPRRAATMCPQTIVDAVRFCSAVFVASGSATPVHFTGRQASRFLVLSTLSFPKSAGRNCIFSACSIAWNSKLSQSVTRCRNCHSCCRDFIIPA
jgi:hypothetical protein